jgi:hypothetical protein
MLNQSSNLNQMAATGTAFSHHLLSLELRSWVDPEPLLFGDIIDFTAQEYLIVGAQNQQKLALRCIA